LIVFEDPAFVDKPLLIRLNIAFVGEERLEGIDGEVKVNVDSEFGAVRAPDVDGNFSVARFLLLSTTAARCSVSTSHLQSFSIKTGIEFE
jgi:hypothetical protein